MKITSLALGGAGVAAVVLIAAVLLFRPAGSGVGSVPAPTPSTATQTGSPTAAPTPSAAPSATGIAIPAMTQAFSSTRHGYSIGYPSGWTATPATKRWTGLDGPDPDAGNMDKLAGPGVQLVVESAPLGSQTPDAWRDAYAARFGLDGVGVCDVLPKNQPRITIGSVQGYLDGDDCPGDNRIAPGDRFFEALAFVDGRVYLFWLQGAIDRAYFDAMLQTVVFDARHASDKP